MRHGYLELNQDSDTDVWVQWLDDDNVSARPDIVEWDGVLTLFQQGAVDITLAGSTDVEVSAFYFLIPQTLVAGMVEGLGSFKVVATHTPGGEPVRLAEGKVLVIPSEVPA